MTPDELHERLTKLATGSLGYIDDALADVLSALIEIHYPRGSRSINTLNCDEHNVTKGPPTWRDDPDYDACPNCVVTPLAVCACWSCDEYPCKTIRAVADALQLDAVTG